MPTFITELPNRPKKSSGCDPLPKCGEIEIRQPPMPTLMLANGP